MQFEQKKENKGKNKQKENNRIKNHRHLSNKERRTRTRYECKDVMNTYTESDTPRKKG